MDETLNAAAVGALVRLPAEGVRALAERAGGADGPAALAALVRAAAAGDLQAPAPALTFSPAAPALDLPDPERVVWAAPHDGVVDAPVCSVGEPAILSAPGGSGKSYVSLMLALQALGLCGPAACGGLAVRRGAVGLLSYEDGPARIGERLRRLLDRNDVRGGPADLSGLWMADDPAGLWQPNPDDSRGGGAAEGPAFDALRDWANRERPSLLIVDPVSAAAAGVSLNEGAAARSCMRSLARLSADSGAGVLIVAHDTKAARNEARTGAAPGAGAVAGSGQWFDAARGVLYLGPAADDGRRLLRAEKVNHGRTGWGLALAEADRAGGGFAGFKAAAECWQRNGRFDVAPGGENGQAEAGYYAPGVA